MKASLSVALLAAFAASYDASALGNLGEVRVVDRDSGAELSTYYYRGEYWIAGRPGARYAIEIRNCTDGRVLAVTSVDGVNVISGATAAWHQTGYVFDPWQRYQITGWRKSNEQVAAFFFTDLSNSYAARTGRPANVGVIGVALFRERVPQPVYTPRQVAPFAREADSTAQGTRTPPGGEAETTAAPPLLSQIVTNGAPAPADSAREAASGSTGTPPPAASGSAAGQAAQRPPAGAVSVPPAPFAKLGTGHGPREYSYVWDTEFERLHPEPDEVIRIRYDSLEKLVAMGILPQPAHPPATPDAFPHSHPRPFVPDPPG